MPDVPVYGAPRVRPRAIRPVQVADTASPIAEGVGRIGQGLDQTAQVLDREILEREIAQSKSKETEFRAGLLDLATNNDARDENGQPAPGAGFYNKRGEDAVTGAGAYRAEVERRAKAFAESGESPRQRRMLKEAADQAVLGEAARVSDYVRREEVAWKDAASLAREAQAASEAAHLYQRPDDIRQRLALIDGEVAERARRMGLTEPDVLLALQKEARGKAVLGVVAAALAREPRKAGPLLAQFGDSIDAKNGAEAAAVVRRAELKWQSEEIAQGLLSSGGTERDINRIEDLDLRSAVRTKFQAGERARRARERELRDDLDATLTAAILETIDGKRTGPEAITEQDIPPQLGIERVMRLRKLIAEGRSRVDDEEVYTRLALMPDEELAKVDLRSSDYQARLTPKTLEHWQDAITAARGRLGSGSAGKQPALGGPGAVKSKIDIASKAMGFPPVSVVEGDDRFDAKTAQNRKFMAFDKFVRRELVGHELTLANIEMAVARASEPVVVGQSGYFDRWSTPQTIPRFLFDDPGDVGALSAAAKDAVRKALRLSGVAAGSITDEMIQGEAYQMILRGWNPAEPDAATVEDD